MSDGFLLGLYRFGLLTGGLLLGFGLLGVGIYRIGKTNNQRDPLAALAMSGAFVVALMVVVFW